MKVFTILYVFYISIPVFIGSCAQKIQIISDPSHKVSIMEPLPEIVYYIDSNGNGVFEKVIVDEGPIPIQGMDEFNYTLHRGIKYPNLAKEFGITGIVILEVIVDENGKVLNVDIKRSLDKACDDEAKRSFLNAAIKGYTPFKWNSKFVKYKMDFPMRFWLG